MTPGKIWVMLALCFYVSRAGILLRFISSQAHKFLGNANHCLKTFVMRINANKTGFVGGDKTSILLVFAFWNVAQICYSIVFFVSVNMVNFILRPFAAYVKPRQSMRGVQTPINADSCVSRTVQPAARNRPGTDALSVNKPSKHSCLGIVVKKLAQTLRGKIGLSHDALLMLIGQRPACVSAHGGLRYFNGELK